MQSIGEGFRMTPTCSTTITWCTWGLHVSDNVVLCQLSPYVRQHHDPVGNSVCSPLIVPGVAGGGGVVRCTWVHIIFFWSPDIPYSRISNSPPPLFYRARTLDSRHPLGHPLVGFGLYKSPILCVGVRSTALLCRARTNPLWTLL